MESYNSFILDIELTNQCNADCVICPRDKLSRPHGFMGKEILEQIIQKLNETKATHAVLSGFGEPALHPHLIEYVNEIVTKSDCYTQMNSNGILLSSHLIDSLAETKLHAINLNVNAINQEDYEEVLPGKDNFKVLMSNIDYMLERKRKGWDIMLKIQASVLDETSEKTKAFYKFWFDKGIDEIIVHPCNNRGGYYEGEHQDAKLKDRNISTYCSIMLFVAWNGDIFSCSHDIEGKYKLGSIHNLEANWIDRAKIPLCDSCNISSFKILEPSKL